MNDVYGDCVYKNIVISQVTVAGIYVWCILFEGVVKTYLDVNVYIQLLCKNFTQVNEITCSIAQDRNTPTSIEP